VTYLCAIQIKIWKVAKFAPVSMLFQPFQTYPEGIERPQKFTYPFHYTPHPLAMQAANELQAYLERQTEWEHDFGFGESNEGLGKMFGVLVVAKPTGELGYLAAFSGKLADSNHWPKFVPPVFDTLQETGFYRIGEEVLNGLNRQLAALEDNADYHAARRHLLEEKNAAQAALAQIKIEQKKAKQQRDEQRAEVVRTLSGTALEVAQTTIDNASARAHFEAKDNTRYWKSRTEAAEQRLLVFQSEIDALRAQRRAKSVALQQQLFEQYTFLNAKNEQSSLRSIFQNVLDGVPPAGAGECAAPKLLQYAYLNGLQPIGLAEFWWGRSPASEIRQHGHFYPACRGKCYPILGHMLQGLEVDEDPLAHVPAAIKNLEIVYEDAYLLVVNKPSGFLSVPGKAVTDSVYTRARALFPEATGPIIVHRLDMATSGLLLLAKTKDVHQHLQAQFAHRRVKKRYVALLDGEVKGDSGLIDFPMRVDLDDRPRQVLCHVYGKPAQTRWEVVTRENGRTKVHFWPLTGRTHQLRVHAAHMQGLGLPIVGDDLYGKPAERLFLHAEEIAFEHPVTGAELRVFAKAAFP
jgi:tRNA pseudouridine32 synthase / 23S rRNA pseudouridine746 synthase